MPSTRAGYTNRFLAGIALVFVLAAIASLLAPKLIKTASLREQVVKQLSTRLHAKVELASLSVSLFPLPHLTVDHLQLSAAPTLDATVESAAVYPRLVGLLAGKLQLAQVNIAGAQVHLHLPRQSSIEATTANAGTTYGLREMLRAGLTIVSSVAGAHRGLAVRLTHGVLNVTAADGAVFTFSDIHGAIQLPPDRLSIDIAAGSDMWEQAALSGAIDLANMHGDGLIVFAGLQLPAMSRYLMPANLEIRNGAAELQVHLTADGLDALHADVAATVPTVDIFERGNNSPASEVRVGSPKPATAAAKHLKLEGAHINAGVKFDDPIISVKFNDVRLDAPPMRLSGTLIVDNSKPQVRLELQGKNLNVADAHEAVVFLATNNPTAEVILNILRAGKVPQLTLLMEGRTLAELVGIETTSIRGSLVGGQVRIPGNGLELEDVNAELSLVKGVLIGEHASARLGNAQANDGSLRVGLTDESRALSVTTTVQADASELPAVLNRVVGNETLKRTLERLTELKGKAEGKLTLRGTTREAMVALEVSTLSVSAKVRDFDRPVQIEGGTIHYNARGIAASGLKVNTGNSLLSGVSVRVDTGAAQASIDVSAVSGRVALGEIYPWVANSGWLPNSVWTPKALSGTFKVESIRVRGPAAEPSQWRIETAGAVERFDVDAPGLRQAVAVRFPLTLAKLRLMHDSVANTLASSFATPDGLTGNLDLRWGAAGLDIKRLTVRDAESNATLSLRLKEREFDMAFAGTEWRSAVNSNSQATLSTVIKPRKSVKKFQRNSLEQKRQLTRGCLLLFR